MVTTQRTIWIGLIVCLIAVLPSCKCVTCGDPPPAESFTFANSQMQMWADRLHIMVDSSFHITQQCKPLYTGKGTIELQFLGGGTAVFIDAPVRDTAFLSSGHRAAYAVSFQANENFRLSWTVRLHGLRDITYGFAGYVRMDSILINGRYYAIDSATADSIAPIGHRFRAYAQTFDVLAIETL